MSLPSPEFSNTPSPAIVDEINVVAGAAIHAVGTDASVEDVVSGIAVDRVALAVAVGLQIGTALQHQIFHIDRQPEVSGRIDGVDTFPGVLDHAVAGVVDDVGVVAGAAEELVRTAGGGERVIAGVAVE